MPKVTIDLLNIDLVMETLTIFKDLLNDERLPEELHLEYGSRFDKLWNNKMTDEEKRNKVEELMIEKPDSELKDAITYDKDGFPTVNATGCKSLKDYKENGGI